MLQFTLAVLPLFLVGPVLASPTGDFLFRCGFEKSEQMIVHGASSWCNMTQATEDQLQWTLSVYGRTPSEPTGPRSSFQGDSFAFMEASSPAKLNDRAKFILPFDQYSGEHCLVFAYSMYGFHVESLHVQNGNNDIWICQGEQGTDWRIANVQLNLNSRDEVSIVAVRGKTYTADIAIDDVRLMRGRCTTSSDNCST